MQLLTSFATSTEAAQPEGLGALGLDVKAFAFQLITFLIVLFVLRKYVFTKLVATLESRRETLEKSLVQAKETEQALADAQTTAGKILKEAQADADKLLGDARSEARTVISEAETVGATKAERIILDARDQLDQERNRLKSELKSELAGLVVAATEKVLKEKMTDSRDKELVNKAVKELS